MRETDPAGACFFILKINPEFFMFLIALLMVPVAIFFICFYFQVESTSSLHKIEEEESPQEKAAREKFEAGQALLNSSRGDKIQVNTVSIVMAGLMRI